MLLVLIFGGLFFRILIWCEICCFLFLFWIMSWILCNRICHKFCIVFRLGLIDDVLISCIVCTRFDHILYKMLFIQELRRFIRIGCSFFALFFVFLLWWMVDVVVRLRQQKRWQIHRHLKGYLQNDLLQKSCFKNLRHLIIINLVWFNLCIMNFNLIFFRIVKARYLILRDPTEKNYCYLVILLFFSLVNII